MTQSTYVNHMDDTMAFYAWEMDPFRLLLQWQLDFQGACAQ